MASRWRDKIAAALWLLHAAVPTAEQAAEPAGRHLCTDHGALAEAARDVDAAEADSAVAHFAVAVFICGRGVRSFSCSRGPLIWILTHQRKGIQKFLATGLARKWIGLLVQGRSLLC